MCKLNVYLDCKPLVTIELNIEKQIAVMSLRNLIKRHKIYEENTKKFVIYSGNPPRAPYFFLVNSKVLQEENQQKKLIYNNLTNDKLIPISGNVTIGDDTIVIVSYFQYTPQQQKPDKVFVFDSQQEPNKPPFLIPGGWWPCDRIYALLDSKQNVYFRWDMKWACDSIWSNDNSATQASNNEKNTFFLLNVSLFGGGFEKNAFLQDQFIFGYCSYKESIKKIIVKYPRDREAQHFCTLIRSKLNIPYSDNIFSLTKEHKESLENGFNFGGNILISPPVKEETEEISKGNGNAGPKIPKHPPAPFGKIIVGDSERGLIGDILRTFLTSQKIQPVLPVDTSWLKVGHVDEFISFIPDNSASSGHGNFKALYADPELMIFMLKRINQEDKNRYTKFFLGKYNIDKEYAEISVENMLNEGKGNYTAEQYNQRLQNERLVPIKKRLQQGLCLEDKDFISIPIFFLRPENVTNDGVRIYPGEGYTAGYTTEAQSVNIINLQYVNGHVIAPRPFGPRLLLEKAKSIVKECLQYKSIKFDVDNLVIDSNITNFYIWHDAGTSLGEIALFYLNLQDAKQIDQVIKHITKQVNLTLPITELQESFSNEILKRNTDKFNIVEKSGNSKGYTLRETVKVLIPEETRTVDVIELYMYAIFKSIGIPETNVHFIDDWVYHINSGEVHCGTVAERSIPSSTLQDYSGIWETMNQYESKKEYIFTYDPKQ